MVHSTEHSFDVFSSWVEAILLKVRDELWHANEMVASRDLIEDSGLDEVWALGELESAVIAGSLQTELLVHESGEEGESLVWEWS